MRRSLQIGLAILAVGTLAGCGAKQDFSQTAEGKKLIQDFCNFPLKLSDGESKNISDLVGITSPDQVTVTKNPDGSYALAVNAGGFNPHYVMSADERTVTPSDKAAEVTWGAEAVNRGEQLGGSNNPGTATSGSSQSSAGTGTASGSVAPGASSGTSSGPDTSGTQSGTDSTVMLFGQSYAPISQNGLTVQVNRIEISGADNITTLYLQATNNSGSQITFSPNATLTQNGRQLDWDQTKSKWFPVGIANGVTVNATYVYDEALNPKVGPATFSIVVGGAYGAVGWDAFQPYTFNLPYQTN